MKLHINSYAEYIDLRKMVELKIIWDDYTCKLIHKKCHKQSYHSDIKYHITLNTKFNVL